MAKPFANAPAYNNTIEDRHLVAIQIGTTTGDAGLAQMKRITVGQLKAVMNAGFGSAWNYVGSLSALPSEPMANDYFLAATTFTSGDVTYTANHLYAYNGSTWSDISGLLSQYATKASLADLDEKVDALIATGISFKGSTTYANLPSPVTSEMLGWEYYVTDRNAMYICDGTQWISTTNIQQTTGQSTINLMSQKAITDTLTAEQTARADADNALGTRIDNIDNGATVVKKAEQDQNGNNIKDTYATKTELNTHTNNTNNPHAVTKAQVGLGNVDNTSDANKPVSTAVQTALDLKANQTAFTAHTGDTNNPHSVTKAQVGLGNVDNTSDLDKPISTAVQEALDDIDTLLEKTYQVQGVDDSEDFILGGDTEGLAGVIADNMTTAQADTILGKMPAPTIVEHICDNASTEEPCPNLCIVSDVPSTSTSTGVKGSVAFDSSYMYICTDTNTWCRLAITTSF